MSAADDLAREMAVMRRRVDALEQAARTPRQSSALSSVTSLLGAVSDLQNGAPVVGSLLHGEIPNGGIPYATVGQATFLTNTSGQFSIPTPFGNALIGVLAATADTDSFAGNIGVYSASPKDANGNYEPVMRCLVGGTPTGQVYVKASWIIYGC